jgi:nucleotide-binding universal stress UspA family protein
MNSDAIYKTILVGDDGTPEAERALDVAIALAQSLGAKLIVLGVIAPPSPESEAEGYGLETAPQARQRIETKLLGKVHTAINRSGIEVAVEILEGKPDEVIVKRAEEDSADLVVVGRREIGRVRQWLEGSTSESLVRHCPISVLVVHDDPR